MSEQTKISWCDSTLNFWEGCTKVSAGCAHCYAEARDKRFTGGLHWGKGKDRRKSKSAVKDALAFNRKPWICDECGETARPDLNGHPTNPWCEVCGAETPWHLRRIFSLSLGDWLDDEVLIECLAEMLDTIRQCDQVTWILCTKRPENWYSRLLSVCARMAALGDLPQQETFFLWVDDWLKGTPPANIILLTSVENQEQAEIRIPQLLKIPAACRGLSLEPLLGPVDVSHWCIEGGGGGLDWLIIGGESGTDARPCNVDWIRSLVQQGKAAGVATFVKQLGADPTYGNDTPIPENLRDKKGGDPTEWPADLRVQEWPILT